MMSGKMPRVTKLHQDAVDPPKFRNGGSCLGCVVMVPGIKTSYDGCARHIQEISKRLSNKGFLVINVLATNDKEPNLQIIDNSYVLLEVPSVLYHFIKPHSSLVGSYLNQFFHYSGFKEAVGKVIGDLSDRAILHTHGFCALTQPGKSKFKRVATFQGFGQLDMLTRDHSNIRAAVLHSALKKVYSNADHYTVFSERMKKTACQLYDINSRKISIVPHGVDAGFFSSRTADGRIKELESKYAIDKPFRVIFVGTLVRGKGLEILLRAMKILKGKRNDVMALLKIGGFAVSSVNGLIEHYGLNGSVKAISDFLSEADFKALYQLSDAFVNFHMMTGYSTTVLEAMASGGPPIIYKNSPNSDLVDESCGLLLKSVSPKELANAIEMLADDPGLRKRLGQSAKNKAARYYDWDRSVVPRYVSLYNRLIED